MVYDFGQLHLKGDPMVPLSRRFSVNPTGRSGKLGLGPESLPSMIISVDLKGFLSYPPRIHRLPLGVTTEAAPDLALFRP